MIHHGRYDMACLGRENSRPGAAARARLLAPAARLLASAVPECRDDLLTFASRLEHGAPPQVGAHGQEVAPLTRSPSPKVNDAMLLDLPLTELVDYRPERTEPADFDSFWSDTLTTARARAVPALFTPYDCGLRTVDVQDVAFSGYDGQPVRAWLLLPRGIDGPLPCVVEYIGYNGGRGLPHEYLLWSAAGYAHLIMDSRGQGSAGNTHAVTPDPDPTGAPASPGYLTRGIASPETYYYRRLFTDAVRAVDTAREHPRIDPDQILVYGGSQGGGLAIAAAGLSQSLAGAMIDVPFLCHFRRAVEITDADPYREIVTYARTHRHLADTAFDTLDYFDCVNHAARAAAPALFSAALMDPVCPPSTVFAAYNHWSGADKDIRIWKYNGHEGGGPHQIAAQLTFVRSLAEAGPTGKADQALSPLSSRS